MNTSHTIIQNEQEAAVAILLSCLHHQHRNAQKKSIEHVSRMLILSSKFYGYSLNELAGNAMPLVNAGNSETVMQYCTPLITDSFKETLFAMVCDLMTRDGQLTERESEVVGLAALYLGVSIEMMRVMITTFLIRNRWNA